MTSDPSFQKVIAIVQKRLPLEYPLSDAQVVGLQAAWDKKGYKSVASHRRTAGHLSNVMAPIYSMLSESFGFSVRKNNFRAVIEQSILGRVFQEEDSDFELSSDEKSDMNPVFGNAPSNELFVGRSSDKKSILEAMSSKQLIVIFGAGGMGKTALVSDLFQKVSKTKNFQKYVWYSSVCDDLERDLFEVCKIIGNPIASTSIEGFFDFIQLNKTLVVLDGVDFWFKNQHEKVSIFVKKLAVVPHPSLILITCCDFLQLITSLQKQGHPVINYKLQGLNVEDSKILFVNNGIGDLGIGQVLESTRGVPLMILETSETIKLLNGNIDQYVKNKTLFVTNAAKERLNKIFTDKDSKIDDRERCILFFFVNKVNENTLEIDKFLEKIQNLTDYSFPDILEAIEILESYSLLSTDKLMNVVRLIKHDEVRGYVAQDPLGLFKFKK
jgi:hypothetical protein